MFPLVWIEEIELSGRSSVAFRNASSNDLVDGDESAAGLAPADQEYDAEKGYTEPGYHAR